MQVPSLVSAAGIPDRCLADPVEGPLLDALGVTGALQLEQYSVLVCANPKPQTELRAGAVIAGTGLAIAIAALSTGRGARRQLPACRAVRPPCGTNVA